MATNNRIQVSELDFDAIKQNLKTYLQGQDQFSDYDFDGSAMSILLDILAYNTHYNAMYMNLAVNEAFLDSASKRASVVSKAKELGYVPSSAKSSTAIVNVVMINNQLTAPASIEIPRYAQFSTNVDGTNYNFVTVEPYIAYKSGNQYVSENIILKEGTLLEFRQIIESGVNSVVIPNAGVDLSTIRVLVQETFDATSSITYTRSDTIIDVDANSTVYFVKELENGLYEIEFGDNLIGKSLSTGNQVTIRYVVCNAEAANGARSFTYSGTMPASTTAYVSTTTPAFGGSQPESIESIKWNAPRRFAAQNRCVTLEDYQTLISSTYPNAASINVWGGETNNPPSYGDVFISIKPADGETLSDGEKNYLLNDVIGPRRLVTVHPKIVDPAYIEIEVNTNFYYSPKDTTRTSNDIALLVRQTIEDYNSQNLDRFGGVFKHSALSRAIDSADPSIRSNITTIKLHREVDVSFNQLVQYIIDIGNPIYNSGSSNSIISTGINVINSTVTCYIEDVPTVGSDLGRLRLFYYASGRKVVVRDIGSIVYSKGLIKIDDIIITGLPETSFKFIIIPSSNDVASVRNQVVSIPSRLITVTPVIETPANTYSFTSSRT